MAHDYLYRRTRRPDAYRLLVPPPPDSAAPPADPLELRRILMPAQAPAPRRASVVAYVIPPRNAELEDVAGLPGWLPAMVRGTHRAASGTYWLPQRNYELADLGAAPDPVQATLLTEHAFQRTRAAPRLLWWPGPLPPDEELPWQYVHVSQPQRQAARAAQTTYNLAAGVPPEEEMPETLQRFAQPARAFRRAAASAYTWRYDIPERSREGELYERLLPARAPGHLRTGHTAYWAPPRDQSLVDVAPSVEMPEGTPHLALPHRSAPRAVSASYLVALATQIKSLLPGPPIPDGHRGVCVAGRPRVQALYGQSGELGGWCSAVIRQGYSVLTTGTHPATHAGGRVIQIDEEGLASAMFDDSALGSATMTDETLEDTG